MSVQHLNMVFDAEGLTSSQKLLLLAYCNYTDAHGYCWAGVERIADDIGASVRTVKRVRTELIEQDLMGTKRRINHRTGHAIPNLTRVNLPLLASMKRDSKRYDDNVIDTISFPAKAEPEDSDVAGPGTSSDNGTLDEQDTCQSDTGTEQQTCQSGTTLDNLAPPRGQNGTCIAGANLAPNPSVIRHPHPPGEAEEEDDGEAEVSGRPLGPVAVIRAGTDASEAEAHALVDQVRAQPGVRSLARYVKTLVANGDMAENLRRLRTSTTAGTAERRPRTELCREHTRPLPCVFCTSEHDQPSDSAVEEAPACR